ncbi:DUF6732 family protein [Minwuia sp.]|uniref:DUF6732 family protein n=1 Tax=Minwuia sp. TaxID=2493630 RepID=UPI003A922DCC
MPSLSMNAGRTLAILTAVSVLPAKAFAHGGHLGELAGHSHWAGIAAAAAAAAIAAAVIKRRKRRDRTEDQPDEAPDEGGEPETAQ